MATEKKIFRVASKQSQGAAVNAFLGSFQLSLTEMSHTPPIPGQK
jgi:hypothetical protein